MSAEKSLAMRDFPAFIGGVSASRARPGAEDSRHRREAFRELRQIKPTSEIHGVGLANPAPSRVACGARRRGHTADGVAKSASRGVVQSLRDGLNEQRPER
jgi:hypothetical protein